MESVKVTGAGISPDSVAEVIREGLGEGYDVHTDGGEVAVVKSGLRRVRVLLSEEDGGTVFKVRPDRPALPTIVFISRLINGGLVKRVSTILREADRFTAHT